MNRKIIFTFVIIPFCAFSAFSQDTSEPNESLIVEQEITIFEDVEVAEEIKEISESLVVDPQTIEKLENGKHEPGTHPNEQRAPFPPYAIFDDKTLLDGYTQRYSKESKEILLAMIKDETLSPYKMAAAVRSFKNIYSHEVFSREKKIFEKYLLHRFKRTNSVFVKVEIMHTLLRMDRYKYFNSMVPALIQKLDHYNKEVNAIAFSSITDITENGNSRAREARIVFNTLRKVLFLSRRRLANIKEPDEKLKQKLELLRWSMKILGSQELRRLPKEVINLL